jgi:hypothetical protein
LNAAPPGLVRLALLIEQNRLDTFRKRLEAARKPRQVQECAVLGPWPPYSFV